TAPGERLHSPGSYRRSILAGSNQAAPRPTSPNRARATIAHTYARFPVATTETRIVPAIAVPKDEPRLDTARDRPEISPCCSSGKLDCTTLTEGVSMPPRPRPISRRPGTKAAMLDVPGTRPIKSPIPTRVTTKPTTISVRCGYFLAKRSAASDE